MSSSYAVQQLVEKLGSGDPDYRTQSLIDISNKASDGNLSIDDNTETQLVEKILSLFNDSNSEVRNLAAKTISLLVSKVKEDRVAIIIERLTKMTSGTDDALRDIASLGLKTVVKEIQPESPLAITACNKLAPKIVAQLNSTNASQDLVIQLIEVLADIYARFETTIRANAAAQTEGLNGLTPLLNDKRGAVRKRSIRAIGNLVTCSSESIFTTLVDKDVIPALKGGDSEALKTGITLSGTLASSVPRRTGKRLAEIAPLVLKAIETSDDEDLIEISLQTLEIFLLRCSSDTATFVPQITQASDKYIKYDPNYAGDMDEDGENGDGGDDDMEDDEDEEDEEDYDDEVSDDDDVSWKVRRASTKVFATTIETRLDLLSHFYRSIAPTLVSRFSEREETVKLEVWNAYSSLLKQTGVWSGGVTGTVPVALISEDGMSSRAASPMSLKRKRGETEGNEGEESPLSLLSSQTSQVSKIVFKQLASSKSVPLRSAGLTLLYNLVSVLQGGLDSSVPSLLTAMEAVLKSSDSASGSSGSSTYLKIQVYSLLALVFKTHPLRSLQPHLSKIATMLVNGIEDKSPKIGAQALIAAAEFVKLIKPATNGATSPGAQSPSTTAYTKSIYDATIKSLSRTDTDPEVRDRGIVCLGDLLLHAGSDFGSELDKGLQILKERLGNENTTLVTLMTLSKIADSPVSEGPLFTPFMRDVAAEVVNFLRRNNKPIQAASFVCLEAVLRRVGSTLSAEVYNSIISALQVSIANPDIHLPRSLNSVSTVLDSHQDAVASVDEAILPSVYDLLASPIVQVQGPALESLLRFFASYVGAGGDASSAVKQLTSLAKEASGGVQLPMVSARCIAAIYSCVVESDRKQADKIIKDASSSVKAAKGQPSSICLGLLTVGEIGRKQDLSEHQDIFTAALKNLASNSEDVRSASAYAIGNMAAGNPSIFLPPILSEIQKASKDDRKQNLLLSSIKELLSHSDPSSLVELSKALWTPLFKICETASAKQQEAASSSTAAAGASAKAGDEARLDGTRNIAAECLGKITLTNPQTYLGQLQSRLQAESAGTRAAVITAIRFTFTDDTAAYDDLLAPLIVQFLSLMHDSDLTVRRLAVASLTSAAHNKPQLIREHMAALQPLLYQETKIDPALIHEVVMGPFKVKVDDGLNIRKAAYQCMYTLLETCLNKIDINAYVDVVVAGLKDDDDIKISCFLMLVKLAAIAPAAVAQRLDTAAQAFDEVLKQKLKETSVKQEMEKLAEMQRSTLRTMAALLPLTSVSSAPRFTTLIEQTTASTLWGAEFKGLVANAEKNKAGSSVGQGGDRMDVD